MSTDIKSQEKWWLSLKRILLKVCTFNRIFGTRLAIKHNTETNYIHS